MRASVTPTRVPVVTLGHWPYAGQVANGRTQDDEASSSGRVLLTGATGFVGRNLYPRLAEAGWSVRCGSRSPERARAEHAEREFCRFDVDDSESIRAALEGCTAAVYLVHSMADGADYAAREREAADRFRAAAEQAKVARVVYLGGVAPEGTPSQHLASRLATGARLRAGSVSTIELQAAMIVGVGSESWRIVRDLSARLPLMLLPRWLESRSEPVAVADVCAAIVHALSLPLGGSAVYGLPGPEVLSARETLQRVARLGGTRPLMFGVPVVTPRLSSYWIRLVTRADRKIAEELVEGLVCDLVSQSAPYWEQMPDYQRTPFETAARRALGGEARTLSPGARAAERLIRAISRAAPASPTSA